MEYFLAIYTQEQQETGEISVFLSKIKSGKSMRGDFSKTLCPKTKWQGPDSLNPGASAHISATNIMSQCTNVHDQPGPSVNSNRTAGAPALQSSPPRAHAAPTWNICVSTWMAEAFSGSCTQERKGLEKREEAPSPLILETLYLTLLKTIRSAGDFFKKLIQNKNRNKQTKNWVPTLLQSVTSKHRGPKFLLCVH